MVNRPNASAAETAVSKDSLFIPLIDFSLYLHGSGEEKKAVSKRIVDGFKDAGFIYIKNHGIPQETIDRVFSESVAFFDRPKVEKEALAWTTPESNRGYTSFGREKVSDIKDKSLVEALRASNPDLKESYEIGRDDEAGLPNQWPDDPRFVSVMKGFFDVCKGVHVDVMRAIAIGLGLDEGFFDSYTDAGDNTLRLLHYPKTPREVFVKNKGQMRAGKHTDYGSITLLFQDSRGGLQVRSPRGTFVDATPIPGTIVINAGDILARWSNDQIRSTEHQVVEPPTPPESDEYPARYSCAYFCNPNFDKSIEAIPGTYKSEEDKKYPSINSGEYLVQRLADTYF